VLAKAAAADDQNAFLPKGHQEGEDRGTTYQVLVYSHLMQLSPGGTKIQSFIDYHELVTPEKHTCSPSPNPGPISSSTLVTFALSAQTSSAITTYTNPSNLAVGDLYAFRYPSHPTFKGNGCTSDPYYQAIAAPSSLPSLVYCAVDLPCKVDFTQPYTLSPPLASLCSMPSIQL
jgi:hypothetical protein